MKITRLDPENGVVAVAHDLTNTMYPLMAWRINGEAEMLHTHASLYGYTFTKTLVGTSVIPADHYFSIPAGDVLLGAKKIVGDCFVVVKYGTNSQHVYGKVQHGTGRLSYVDGCSDSLLVYPPRLGDPSLNYLYFPNNIYQTAHNHPSVRVGVVIKGECRVQTHNSHVIEYTHAGEAEYHTESTMVAGDMFYIPEKVVHNFYTNTESAEIVVFHPDGDFGPTDEVHTMLNRTHIVKAN